MPSSVRSVTCSTLITRFHQDTLLQDAVIRTIEIIGEAANKIRQADPDFAKAHADVPWDAMYGMRNRIVHDYFQIDLEIVWRTVHQDLPTLRSKIEALLAAITGQAP